MLKRRMVLALGGRRGPSATRDETGETAPRTFLFDDLFERRCDEAILDEAPRHLRAAYRPLPPWARLALEIHRRRDEHDVVVTWSERVSLSLMALQTLTRRGKPHIAMMYWFSRPSVRLPMRLFSSSLSAIVTWSSVQRRYAIEELGIPEDRIHLVHHYVDQRFFSPREREVDMICAAGAEMRDYPTLLEALRGTGLRCHVATDHVRVDRHGFARRLSVGPLLDGAPPGVTIGKRTQLELRELYARSRFVVVPLEASDTDNGVTVILEAMAMGKPVICSRTRGQVDVIEEGVTGLFVPVGDARALREAMLALWHDPVRAGAMGRAGRARVERFHALERFVRDVAQAIDASVDARAGARRVNPGALAAETRGDDREP